MKPSPDSTPANDEAIEAMAAGWLVQKDEGFTPEQAAEFARWRDASPKHAAAIAMLEETCGILTKMPALKDELEAERPKPGGAPAQHARPKRAPASQSKMVRFPTWVKIAVAAAACVVFALVLRQRSTVNAPPGTVYATGDRGYERVVLPDESVIALNANTEVRVNYAGALREISLVRGEAHFAVAKNPARPFVVGAGRFAVRAVGTAFNVRHDQKAVEVLVTEGRVQVSEASIAAAGAATADTATPSKPLLGAGQRIVMENAVRAEALGALVTTFDPAAARVALAWHSPLLNFDATPLSDVVRQFNAHNRVKLEIGDPELSAREVGGTFYANNVEVFVSLLEKSRDIAVERPDADRIVLRKVKR